MIHFRFGHGGPIEYSLPAAILFLLLAALFVLSYFFESHSRLFGYVMYFCERLSFPGMRVMAFAYAVLFTFGAYLFLTGAH